MIVSQITQNEIDAIKECPKFRADFLSGDCGSVEQALLIADCNTEDDAVIDAVQAFYARYEKAAESESLRRYLEKQERAEADKAATQHELANNYE